MKVFRPPFFKKVARIQRRVALVARRNGRNSPLRQGKDNLNFGYEIPKIWDVFSAKEIMKLYLTIVL